MSDQLLNQARRRSLILTNPPLLKVSNNSTPSLAALPKIRAKKSNKKQNVGINTIKTRQQLMHQQRFRDLLKLKADLNDLQIEHTEYRQKCFQNNIVQNDYIQGIQDKLDSFIYSPKKEIKNNSIEISSRLSNNNSEKKDFVDGCSQLEKVSNLILKGILHFKIKLFLMFKNMSFKQLFENIFETLQKTEAPDLDKIYKNHKQTLKDIDHLFWKELKIVSLQCGYMLDNYHKNRYKNLNEDISRIKKEMLDEGNHISNKLKQIDNMPLKQGIFQSLKHMDFECLANRYIYRQLNDRIEKNHQFPIIF